MAAKPGDKRCMTQLGPETARRVSELRDREGISESRMLAILIEEALENRTTPRRPQRSDD
jgi:hypothetical protein